MGASGHSLLFLAVSWVPESLLYTLCLGQALLFFAACSVVWPLLFGRSASRHALWVLPSVVGLLRWLGRCAPSLGLLFGSLVGPCGLSVVGNQQRRRGGQWAMRGVAGAGVGRSSGRWCLCAWCAGSDPQRRSCSTGSSLSLWASGQSSRPSSLRCSLCLWGRCWLCGAACSWGWGSCSWLGSWLGLAVVAFACCLVNWLQL